MILENIERKVELEILKRDVLSDVHNQIVALKKELLSEMDKIKTNIPTKYISGSSLNSVINIELTTEALLIFDNDYVNVYKVNILNDEPCLLGFMYEGNIVHDIITRRTESFNTFTIVIKKQGGDTLVHVN